MKRSSPDYGTPPAYLSAVEFYATAGDEVADLCAQAGFAPDPEQRLILDQVFAADRRGVPVAAEAAVVCPRQNLKTGSFKQVALGWLFITGEPYVVWSAHEFKTAAEAFRDMVALIESMPSMDRRIKAVHRAAGNEGIELVTGQRLDFKARTKTGARGLSAPKLVLDEAFALQPSHMGSLLPTMAAMGAPQVLYGSSAGLVTSEVLRALRDRGRAGGDRRLFYAEWCDPHPNEGCAADDCDHGMSAVGCALDDPARLAAANPALGRRIMPDTLAMLRRAMPPSEFAREFLGWWDEAAQADSDFTVDVWQSAVTLDAPEGRMVLAADTAPSHAWSSIVVCGGGVLELVDRRRGSSWLPERLRDLCDRHGITEVVLDPSGPIAGIVPDLEAAGVTVRLLSGAESTAACGQFVDAVSTLRVRPRPADAFTAAVAGAARRKSGDRWKWSRVSSEVDISPLVAATWAAWSWADSKSAAYDVLASVY